MKSLEGYPVIVSTSSLSQCIVQSRSHAPRYRAPGMLSTIERRSASLERKRAARSPAATRATRTSGSNGTRITSSAPVSSAARSSSGESSAAATTTWVAASSGLWRSAGMSDCADGVPAITTGIGRAVSARRAPATSCACSRRSPASTSTVQQSSRSSSRPISNTRAECAPVPLSARAGSRWSLAPSRDPSDRHAVPRVSDMASPAYRLAELTATLPSVISHNEIRAASSGPDPGLRFVRRPSSGGRRWLDPRLGVVLELGQPVQPVG